MYNIAMEPMYVVLICAGGVFALFFIFYLIYAIESYKIRTRNEIALKDAYSEKNLTKMEYDVAFYDGDTYETLYGGNVNRQVTIDEVLSENQRDEESVSKAQRAIFTQVEDEGSKNIIGTYNPETSN